MGMKIYILCASEFVKIPKPLGTRQESSSVNSSIPIFIMPTSLRLGNATAYQRHN